MRIEFRNDRLALGNIDREPDDAATVESDASGGASPEPCGRRNDSDGGDARRCCDPRSRRRRLCPLRTATYRLRIGPREVSELPSEVDSRLHPLQRIFHEASIDQARKFLRHSRIEIARERRWVLR